MSLEVWIAFTLTSAVLLAIPGPTVMLVVSYALGRGHRSGLATVPGVALGDFTAITISLLGAGAALAASASLFTALKLAGAAYLVWLGIRLWRAPPNFPDTQTPASDDKSGSGMFWNAYLVTVLNPKGIVFFVAFAPQFVDPARPLPTQFAILIATFVTLATLNVIIWAYLAGEMRARFRKPSTLRMLNRVGASFLIGAGVFTALTRQSP